MRFRKGSAKNSEVLGENIHQSSVNFSVTGHHSITRIFFFFQSEICGAMGDEHSDLFEASFIEQKMQTFSCSKLSFFMLCVNPVLPSAKMRFRNFIAK